MSEANKKIVQEFLAAVLRGDRDGMRPYLHPDLQVVEPASLPYGGVWKGHDGMFALSEKVFSVWKDCQVTIRGMVADGDKVVGLYEMRGAGRNSGIPFTVHVTEVMRIQDGMIKDIEVFYFDTKMLDDVHTGNRAA